MKQTNGKYTGRPRNVSEEWDVIFQSLKNPFWNSKGLSSTCPFCHGESDAGKMRFLILFNNGIFQSYGCFSCNAHGRSWSGLNNLVRQLNLDISSSEIGVMSGQGAVERYSGDRTVESDSNDSGGVIEWPPRWVKATDELMIDGMRYVEEKRRLGDAVKVIEKYNLVISSVVEMRTGDNVYERDHPSVIAPMHGISDEGEIEVLGWMTRRIDGGEPKSFSMAGSKWKTKSLFGLTALDNRKPVVITEGIFSAMSTPNAVAIGGKVVGNGQIDLLAGTGASLFIFALDPEVDVKQFSAAMYRLSLLAPGSKVLKVEWEKFGGASKDDPNDRGREAMAEIIRRTVLDAAGK